MAILTRQTTGTGVTNNNAPLNNSDLDNNFIELVAQIASKLSLSGGTLTGALTINSGSATTGLDLVNNNIVGVNNIEIQDPGPNEGISWIAGNLWKIYESPNDLTTNGGGNLQIVQNTTRRATFNTTGQLEIPVAAGTAPFLVSSNTVVANLNSDLLDGQQGSYYLDWTNVTNKPDPVITVTLTGDVTGTANTTLTDLANGTVTVATTIAANSVALGTDTTGNYVASITNGSYITGANGGSEGAALTLAVDATSTNTASKVVARDASGNFSAGTITANLTGSASNNVLKSGDTMTGDLIISKLSPKIRLYDSDSVTSTPSSIEWDNVNNQGVSLIFNELDSELPTAGYGLVLGPSSTNTQFPSTGTLTFNVLGEIYAGATTLSSLNKVWHAGNDGSGSGLDADLLDGQQGSYYLDWTNVTNKPDPVVTVTLTGDVTGTANTTLTDLANGTVTVATTIAANSVALGTDTTGNYVASITNGSYITGANGGSEGAALTLAVDATSTNTASKVVARDASGNFSAGTITAALTGNASTATTLETSRTINGTSFNGSANITTANWGTSRTITIGSTGKSVNGSGNVSWTLAEIGALGSTAKAADSELLDGQDSTNYLRTLTSGTEASLDTYTDNGVRSISYTGYSKSLLSWNTAGSVGTVQQEFDYNTSSRGWRVRNKTDSTTWSTWGYVTMTSANQGLITGNIVHTAGSYADPAWITSLAKSKVGLGNVENTALSTWAGSTNITTVGAVTATSLSVTGNLTVNGTTTTVNSTTVTLDDPIITLGGDTAPATNDSKDRGVEFRWHDGTSAKVGFFGFDASSGYLTFIPDATNTSEVFSGTLGDIQATNFRGSLVGNASTATTLETSRTINGTSFNGSANITTANWGTSRTITIGSTGKSVNGSGNVSWTLAEIGAQAASTALTTSTTFGGDVSGAYNAIVVTDDSHNHSSSTGNFTVGGDLTVSGGDVTINNNNGIAFNDSSAYWLKTATNWGVYWDTTDNRIEFHGTGVDRWGVDLDNGNSVQAGSITADSAEFTGLGLNGDPGTDDLYVGGYGIQGSRTGGPVYIHNYGTTGVRISSTGSLGTANGILVEAGQTTVSGDVVATSYKTANWTMIQNASGDLEFNYA